LNERSLNFRKLFKFKKKLTFKSNMWGYGYAGWGGYGMGAWGNGWC
jgi:hypothetical protein